MYDRTKLKTLIEECVKDAREVTIYRDLQTEVIRCLFNARLEEAKVVDNTITELGNPDPIVSPNATADASGTVTTPQEDVTAINNSEETTEGEKPEETNNDETQS